MAQLSLFSQRLRQLMIEFNVNKAQVNQKCNLNSNQIKYWEDTGNLPKFDALDRLARFFNVSTAYLSGTTNERGKYENPYSSNFISSPSMKELEKAIFTNEGKDDQDDMAKTFGLICILMSKMNRHQLARLYDFADYITSKK